MEKAEQLELVFKIIGQFPMRFEELRTVGNNYSVTFYDNGYCINLYLYFREEEIGMKLIFDECMGYLDTVKYNIMTATNINTFIIESTTKMGIKR